MVDYVKVNDGAWNLAASWDIGSGWPTSAADTAMMADYDTEIPFGVSIICGAITMTGVDAANRSRLIQNGDLEITGNITLNAWNEWLRAPGTLLEINGNDALLTSNVTNHNRLVWVGTPTNRVRTTSSVPGTGRIWHSSAVGHCHVDMQYLDFIDIAGLGGVNESQGIGENFNFTSGEFVNVENFTFTGCRESSFGGFNHIDATQIIRYGDVRAGLNIGTYALYISDAFVSSVGNGTIISSNLTFDTTVNSYSLQLKTRRPMTAGVCVFSNAPFHFLIDGDNSPDIEDSFSYVGDTAYGPTEIAIGAAGQCTNMYVINERNNPKPFNILFSSIQNPVVELTWVGTYDDDGDLFILAPTTPTALEHGLVIDERSCVLFNALGAVMSSIYNGHHNTLIGNYDAAYGSLCRTESGGSFSGTLNMNSNIIFNKTPVAGSLGFNFAAAIPPDDMVTEMDFNCWYGIDDPYHGVTSATKIPGVTVGYGGNDITDNPDFLDITRSAAQYDLLQGLGAGTVASLLSDMLNINGYDDATKTQIAANASPRRPLDLHTWVRGGAAPTNIVFQDAGHDGVTIGAVEYISSASISAVDSPVLDAEAINSLTTSGFSDDITSLIISDVATGTFTTDISASLSGTAGSFTFDMPDIAGFLVNTTGTPFDSASHTHVITAGFLTESASAPIVVNPKAGWMVVEVESASMLVGSLFEDWTPTPPDGCQIYIPTADNTSATAAGILTTDRLTGTIDWMFFDIDTGLWEPHTVTLPSGGFLNRNYFWDNK